MQMRRRLGAERRCLDQIIGEALQFDGAVFSTFRDKMDHTLGTALNPAVYQ